MLLRQQPVVWVCEFLDLHGVEALCDLLELFEKRTFKKAHDFELMDQVRPGPWTLDPDCLLPAACSLLRGQSLGAARAALARS